MLKHKNKKTENSITVKAINIETNEVMFEGYNGEEILKKAEASGKDYILDFVTDSEYNFVF